MVESDANENALIVKQETPEEELDDKWRLKAKRRRDRIIELNDHMSQLIDMTVVLGNKVAFYEDLVKTQKQQKLALSDELERTKASLRIEHTRVQDLDRQHKELCHAGFHAAYLVTVTAFHCYPRTCSRFSSQVLITI